MVDKFTPGVVPWLERKGEFEIFFESTEIFEGDTIVSILAVVILDYVRGLFQNATNDALTLQATKPGGRVWGGGWGLGKTQSGEQQKDEYLHEGKGGWGLVSCGGDGCRAMYVRRDGAGGWR